VHGLGPTLRRRLKHLLHVAALGHEQLARARREQQPVVVLHPGVARERARLAAQVRRQRPEGLLLFEKAEHLEEAESREAHEARVAGRRVHLRHGLVCRRHVLARRGHAAEGTALPVDVVERKGRRARHDEQELGVSREGQVRDGRVRVDAGDGLRGGVGCNWWGG